VSAVPVPCLWITGVSGVGKSSVGWEVYRQVRANGAKAAYVDFDQIGFCLPAPADEPANHRLKASNLAALWPNYRAAGARWLVVSGFVDTPEEIRTYAAAVPDTVLTVCRLTAGPEQLKERILRRGWGGGPRLPGDPLYGQTDERLLEIAAESARTALTHERDGIDDVRVDTDGLSIHQVARLVLERAADHAVRARRPSTASRLT
jgi:Adenylylsulphate kinase